MRTPTDLGAALPPLPLLLWGTPPGLELILRQEGVPFEVLAEPHPIVLRQGRFILFDGRRAVGSKGAPPLSEGQVAIDVDRLRHPWPFDPFDALIDNRAGPATWRIAGVPLIERVARRDKGAIRRTLLDALRTAVAAHGGLWVRLSAFPYPYRAAFNLRLDLDEPIPGDYRRFAKARRPLDDCSTHFVSTAAYGRDASVLDDLRGLDAQSHGHFHVVYRDPIANRRNLERAHRLLADAGIEPVGFAAPEGRWNPGLDDVMEDLGYRYSSDFGLGYDDLPFYPWRGARFSKVLQVPVHPICEGLFVDAGLDDGQLVADHLVRAVRARIDAGEPAFVYGHPERRLARFPEVLRGLAREAARYDLLWRTTLTEFARWWDWRSRLRWSIARNAEGLAEYLFEGWDTSYTPTLEVVRGRHVAGVPATSPRGVLRIGALAFEGPTRRVDLPQATASRPPLSLRAVARRALDWETVTPVEDLPGGSVPALLKKNLRRWRERLRRPGTPPR